MVMRNVIVEESPFNSCKRTRCPAHVDHRDGGMRTDGNVRAYAGLPAQ